MRVEHDQRDTATITTPGDPSGFGLGSRRGPADTLKRLPAADVHVLLAAFDHRDKAVASIPERDQDPFTGVEIANSSEQLGGRSQFPVIGVVGADWVPILVKVGLYSARREITRPKCEPDEVHDRAATRAAARALIPIPDDPQCFFALPRSIATRERDEACGGHSSERRPRMGIGRSHLCSFSDGGSVRTPRFGWCSIDLCG